MTNGAVDKSIQMKFKPGDELLQIDSNSLYAINYLDLLNILKSLDNRMHILVCARAFTNQDLNDKSAETKFIISSSSSIKRNKTDGNIADLKSALISTPRDALSADSLACQLKTSHSAFDEEAKKKQVKIEKKKLKKNVHSPLLIRSRLLEFSNLIMWSSHVHHINLIKGSFVFNF